MSNRVVVTGVGLVTPLGLSREATWARLCAGESGICSIAGEYGSAFACRFAGRIDLAREDLEGCPSKTHAVALRCATEALADAGLRGTLRRELPTWLGNNVVEYSLERKRAIWHSSRRGNEHVRTVRDLVSRASAGTSCSNHGECTQREPAEEEFALGAWVRERMGLRGPVATLASNCVGGTQAIILGALRIAAGRCERALVGGIDCAVTPEMLARFSLLHALTLSREPGCSRPFDHAHSGMVLADGAGFLVLESEAAARRRNARTYARITGWGMTSDSYHLTRGAPDARGKAAAIRQALTTAAIDAETVELVSAHGTGTVDNDVTEIRALRLALGETAERVAITAAKSALGHSLAGSGAVESGLSVLTFRDGVVPPILNLTRPADACHVAGLVQDLWTLRPRAVLKNSFAFGGFNACIVFQPPDDRGSVAALGQAGA